MTYKSKWHQPASFLLALLASASAYTNEDSLYNSPGEVSLYNSAGDAVAYIDYTDEKTIWLWSGEAVAYLDEESNDVWGWNGKHLGWFSGGALIDQSGAAPCVVRQRHPAPKFETFRSLQQLQGLKSLRVLPPLEPLATGKFSDVDCRDHLMRGE